MVLPDSHGVPRAPRYLGNSLWSRRAFAYEAVTRYGLPSQASSANTAVSYSTRALQHPHKSPCNPAITTPASYRVMAV